MLVVIFFLLEVWHSWHALLEASCDWMSVERKVPDRLATGCRLSGRFLIFRFLFHLSTEANGHSWVLGTQTGDQLLQQLHGDARRVECL